MGSALTANDSCVIIMAEVRAILEVYTAIFWCFVLSLNWTKFNGFMNVGT